MAVQNRFNVIFEGIICSGYDEVDVKEKLCKLCQTSIHSFVGKQILLGYPVAIKRNLSLAEAEIFKDFMIGIGAECTLAHDRNKTKLRSCPRCHIRSMNLISYKNVEIDICNHCGGRWFEKGQLDKVILKAHPEYTFSIIESLGIYKGASENYCPNCDIKLKIYSMTQEAGLQIGVCAECCGIWVEKEQFNEAKAFYEAPLAMKVIDKKTTWQHWLFQFFLCLPVEFNIKPKAFPIVTTSLISINIIIMILLYIQESPENVIKMLGLVPAANKTFFWFLTLLSYQFIHGSLFHLIGNMYFLYILGKSLEDVLGRLHYIAFYLICGIAAGLVQVLLTSSAGTPIIGASGAVAGVMAGYMVIFRKAKLTFMFIFWQKKLSASWYCLIWIIFNFIGAFSNVHIAWYAHLGGFATGLIWAYASYASILQKNPLIKFINIR